MLSDNILTVVAPSPNTVLKQVCTRAKERRLDLNLTQEGLAKRSGLPLSTYRRFERTGEISFRGLLQVAFALNMLSDFDELFCRKQYESIDQLLSLKNKPHVRGKKK